MRISDWRSDVCSSDLDAVAELVGIGDVQCRHVADALDIDRSEIDLAAEGQRGENGKLVRGVDAVDVEAGVRLRVAEPLRLGQHAQLGRASWRESVWRSV